MKATNSKAYAKLVENGIQAVETVNELRNSDYLAKDIFVLAHSEDRTDRIADKANAKEIGLKEEGVIDSIANLFRSRGDELRAKIVSIGFTETEAEYYERELDKGKVLVIAVRSV
ncbi:general stress protein [Paenibacillus polygoni]|uniref:General stress protein n=1 Tax=Paenibacillus polygoni TaxID=3050112 RepID=A0ABY8X657_9BACL|nr:general stress protein [Paenibacillus polygoni]WIV18700.1 general stress protein [Paenibacillus polygoni]